MKLLILTFIFFGTIPLLAQSTSNNRFSPPAPPKPPVKHIELALVPLSITPVSREDEEDAEEAVFRFLMATYHSEIIDTKLVFISIVGEDHLRSTLLKRFAKDSPCVGDGKRAELLSTGFQDRTTHEKGIFFHIEPIQWFSASSAQVMGGYTKNLLYGMGGLWKLTKVGGKWTVESTGTSYCE